MASTRAWISTRIHAVLGGFHLSGPPFEPFIGPTCAAFAEFSLDPHRAGPLHRLGGHAHARRPLPRAFIQNSVGTRHEFTAAGA
jgi:7,8-dihydropterin-6-yl-methyl-4-(beta-D-ribofuranosyl)aminobenzene 5'-phosphate synthase